MIVVIYSNYNNYDNNSSTALDGMYVCIYIYIYSMAPFLVSNDCFQLPLKGGTPMTLTL